MKEFLRKIWIALSPTYRDVIRILEWTENLQLCFTSNFKELVRLVDCYSRKTDKAVEQTGRISSQIDGVLKQVSQLIGQTEIISGQIKCVSDRIDQLAGEQTSCLNRIDNVFNQTNGLRQQLNEYLRPQNERFTNHYEYWRAKRITAIVEHYGEAWFEGKKILELGCGYGDIGHVLMTLNADVTFAEGRAENCDFLRRRFPENRVYCMNCENEWPFPADAHFDLILHMGLLYHLDDLWFALDHCFECCDNIVLETEVSDSDDPDFILKINECVEGWDQSLIGHGSRPSGPCVEKHIHEKGWQYERVTDSRCNARFHVYDWKVENTKTWRSGLRRFWFCKKENNEC